MMRADQDFRHFGFEGSFRFVGTHCSEETKIKRGGKVTLDLQSDQQAICDKKSWSIQATKGAKLLFTLPGRNLKNDTRVGCGVRSRYKNYNVKEFILILKSICIFRLVVRASGGHFAVICPEGEEIVKMTIQASDNILQTVTVHLTGKFDENTLNRPINVIFRTIIKWKNFFLMG